MKSNVLNNNCKNLLQPFVFIDNNKQCLQERIEYQQNALLQIHIEPEHQQQQQTQQQHALHKKQIISTEPDIKNEKKPSIEIVEKYRPSHYIQSRPLNFHKYFIENHFYFSSGSSDEVAAIELNEKTFSNQIQHNIFECIFPIITFIVLIILLKYCCGVHIVKKSTTQSIPSNNQDLSKSKYQNGYLELTEIIDYAFEFNYYDEWKMKRKRKVKKALDTVLEITDKVNDWIPPSATIDYLSERQSFRDKTGIKRENWVKNRKCVSVGPIFFNCVESETQPILYDHNLHFDTAVSYDVKGSLTVDGSQRTSFDVCVNFLL